jgi:hypothetical protein
MTISSRMVFPSFLDDDAGSFRETAGKLEEARATLIACYEKAEDGAKINPAAFDGVHKVLSVNGRIHLGEVELQSLVRVFIKSRKDCVEEKKDVVFKLLVCG